MTITCPSCEREFDTTQSFCSHWGMSHNGPTPDSIDTSKSDEHKQKISENACFRNVMGEDHPRHNDELTEESKQRISEKLSGETHPNYTS